MAVSKFKRWLDVDARQPDGSLWPASPDGKPSRKDGGVSRRAVDQVDPFTRQERQFLRDRLLVLERTPGGLSAGPRSNRRSAKTSASLAGSLTPALQGLVDRGLVEFATAKDGDRHVFTEAGLAALRRYFSRQPANFAVLFPALHRQLGLAELLRRSYR